MKFGLSEETISRINAVFANYTAVEEAVIYGSRAKGNYRDGSDIDITLKGKDLTTEMLSKIGSDIDELNTPYLFDISIFHLLKSHELVDHIERVGQVFYKKQS